MADIKIKASPDEIQQVLAGGPQTIPSIPLPPPPPMPTPARAGYGAFASDPINQSAVSKHISSPDTPILPPPPSVAAPQPWNPQPSSIPSSAPPQMSASTQTAPKEWASWNPPQSPNLMTPPNAEPSPAAPYQSQLVKDQTELQRLQATKSGASQIKNPFLRTLAEVGDVAGSIVAPRFAQFIPGTTLHNQMLQGQADTRIDADRQNIQDVQKSAQTAATIAHEQAQTGDIGAKHQLQLSKLGLKEVPNPITGGVDTVPDTDSPVYKTQQAKDAKMALQTQLIGAQIDNTKAQKALRDAQTAFENMKGDPTSNINKQIAQRLAIAQQNANAAQTRAKAYWGSYLERSTNTGLDGNYLPGAPQIADESGNITVPGTANAKLATTSNANVAQFNDVFGAADNLRQTASNVLRNGGKLDNPLIAAAMAQPKGTSSQWLQGQLAKSNLNPVERNYVVSSVAFRENLQALRKSSGGSVSDSQVDRLLDMAPNASTPDIDYLNRQMDQIEAQATRLGQGASTAGGGLTVHGRNPNPASKPNLMVPPSQGGAIPSAAAAQLREGVQHTFNNGQVWTLKNGSAVRIR